MVQKWVIDASILIQGYVTEAQTPRVRTLLRGAFNSAPVSLHIPEFCMLECANILWKRVKFYDKPAAESKQALADLIAFPITVYPASGLLPRALTIGLDSHLAVYDAVYIALAEALGCPLITADQRQASAAAAVGVELKSIEDFPEFRG